MRMKRLFAGLAAAATLLGGMALGTTTANAADPASTLSFGNTITLNTDNDKYLVTADATTGAATTTPRTFKAVKIADYVGTPDATNGPAVTLQTVNGTVKTQIQSALSQAVTGATYDATTDGDPLVWLTKQTGADYRKLADAVADALKDSANVAPTEALSQDNKSLTLTFGTADAPAPGVYLIYDQSGDQTFKDGSKTYVTHGFKTILAGTAIYGANPEVTVNNGGTIQTTTLDAKSAATPTVTGAFSFSKVDADGKVVTVADEAKSAKFTITNAEGKYLTKGADNAYTFEDTATDGSYFQSATGVYFFNGLSDGTYTVTETQAPDGFIDNALGTFKVTLADGKVTSVDTTSDTWKLVTYDQTAGTITVKNVKSITQLPLTGAAGTILFSVVALLLAGAGVTVFVRSRRMSKQLA